MSQRIIHNEHADYSVNAIIEGQA